MILYYKFLLNFSITQRISSPFLRKTGGFKPIPTPLGVPIDMMVPAFKSIPELSSSKTYPMSKIKILYWSFVVILY